MELSTKQKGNLTELECITAFYKLGYKVSIPYGENSRYDFIADIEGKLVKIQVKTSRLKKNTDDAITFSCRSTTTNKHTNTYHSYSKEEIDFFATSWKEQVYLVPVEECSVDKTLRFSEPKNGQKQLISFAKDYEIEKVINKIVGEIL